jgi:hypothetical protein
MAEVIRPTRQRLAFSIQCSGAFPLNFGFVEIPHAIIAKEGLVPDCRQSIFSSLVSLNLKRFTRGSNGLDRLLVLIEKRKTTARLFAVSEINPKLGVKAAPSNLEPGDSPIARVPCGNKLGAMISGHSTREPVSTGVRGDFVALKGASLLNSSTNSSTNAFYVSSLMRKCLIINDARVAKLADAPDLGSGGAILRGSSPLPGTKKLRS